MSGNARGTGLALRIREWDDAVEEDGDMADASKPYDGGIMLAIATLFEAYDGADPDDYVDRDPDFAKAMKELRETVEQVIE